MKKLALLSIIVATVLAACSGRRNAEADPSDYPETFYTPRYASGFTLRNAEGDTTRLMLEVNSPRKMYVAIPQGGFRSIVCMSSTYVGLLDAVGTTGRISAVSSREYLTNEEVKRRVADVGYDGAMDYESLLSAKPDIALIYGIGGESAIAVKLEELGVNYVYISDFIEQNPLGKAEWMVALAALTGTDGRRTFEEVVRGYEPVSGDVAVMLNAPYGGAWFIPGTESYMTRLIADAGGRLTISQPAGIDSKPADMEVAVPALNRAQVWLNPGQVASAEQARSLVPHADFRGRIWNQTPDFYESGAARPDLVLRELQRIFNGSADSTLHYFTPLK